MYGYLFQQRYGHIIALLSCMPMMSVVSRLQYQVSTYLQYFEVRQAESFFSRYHTHLKLMDAEGSGTGRPKSKKPSGVTHKNKRNLASDVEIPCVEFAKISITQSKFTAISLILSSPSPETVFSFYETKRQTFQTYVVHVWCTYGNSIFFLDF